MLKVDGGFAKVVSVMPLHGDDDVRGREILDGDGAGMSGGGVDAELGEGLGHDRVDLLGRDRACGAHLDAVARELPEITGGHLRTARVVHADE